MWNKKITVPKAPNFASKTKVSAVKPKTSETAKRHKMYPKSDKESQNMKPNTEIEAIV